MKTRLFARVGLLACVAALMLFAPGGTRASNIVQPLYTVENTEQLSLWTSSGIFSPVVQPPAGNWRIETVDSEGYGGTYPSLALDKSGRPHISYCSNENLKYAWHDGAAWHIETVDSEGYIRANTSLALDSSGHPHISYYNATGENLKYAWHDVAGWHVETVDSVGDRGSHNSLALDGLDRPHVSYYHYTDWNGGSLKYACHDGDIWHIETVDSGESYGGMGYATSLALDKSDRPHISYRGLNQISYEDELRYACHDGSMWHIETVDSREEMGGNTSLVLDISDWPHIGYFDEINERFRYAWYDGTDWHIEAVDGVMGEDARQSSLALDTSERPHFSYFDELDGELRYAWHDGTNWHVETVAEMGDSSPINSLALDKHGWPHITYHDSTGYDLKYAHLLPPCLDKQATPKDGLRNNDTLTYTLNLSGSAVSVQLWDPLPENVDYITGSVTSPAIYSPTIRAVVWQGVLPTDTVQTIRFQVIPNTSEIEEDSLSPPIVNTAWLTDTAHSKGVSAMIIVNGQKRFLPLVLRDR